MNIPAFEIGGRKVGREYPPLVVAEIGINHGGSLDVAIAMADAAIDAGAEVIKHQTHIIEDEMANEAKDRIPGNSDMSIHQIMAECALDEVDESQLLQHIRSRGATFMSTPFSRLALERLKKFGVPAIKVGSGECNNYPFIKECCSLGVPIILSTGMNSIETVRPAVEIIRGYRLPFALLHCTNVYPTPQELVRLNCIEELQQVFPDAVCGLSDHTDNVYACIGAVALGASILERHFTDCKSRVGPDISCSMDPSELSQLKYGAKQVWMSLGAGKEICDAERVTANFAFSSVVALRNLRSGELLDRTNIFPMRPSGGDFGPEDFESLLGRRLVLDVKKGAQLRLRDLGGE
ncbi:N-acetylneuraminate synthase family protein [Litoricolaceae bacterium]|nr:N-acetylneuraminate synthase family protein [Litorivicinaceae bacterium]